MSKGACVNKYKASLTKAGHPRPPYLYVTVTAATAVAAKAEAEASNPGWLVGNLVLIEETKR